MRWHMFIRRAVAYWLDCTVCYAFLMVLVQWAILSNIRERIGITEEWFMDSWNMEIYVLLTISLPTLLYFSFLDMTKGTLGKRAMKLRVYHGNGTELGFGRSLLRSALKLAPWEIAHVGVVFPTPLYYETEPSVRILTIVGLSLLACYVSSMYFFKDGRTLVDLIMKTKVKDTRHIRAGIRPWVG